MIKVKDITAAIAHYIDNHLDRFAEIEAAG